MLTSRNGDGDLDRDVGRIGGGTGGVEEVDSPVIVL